MVYVDDVNDPARFINLVEEPIAATSSNPKTLQVVVQRLAHALGVLWQDVQGILDDRCSNFLWQPSDRTLGRLIETDSTQRTLLGAQIGVPD